MGDGGEWGWWNLAPACLPARASLTRVLVTRRAPILLYVLLAAALFMRAFVPQGYMPERSGDGAIAVAMCASGGVHLIPLKDEGSAPADRAKRAGEPCAFAGLGHAVPPPAVAEPAPPIASTLAPFAGFAAAGPAGAPRLRPPARGPPLPA